MVQYKAENLEFIWLRLAPVGAGAHTGPPWRHPNPLVGAIHESPVCRHRFHAVGNDALNFQGMPATGRHEIRIHFIANMLRHTSGATRASLPTGAYHIPQNYHVSVGRRKVNRPYGIF